MPTERIDIIVSENGSRTVKRNLNDLATAADQAGDETAELQRRLNAISPTAELAQTMRQMNALRDAMNQRTTTSDWPRRPIAEANEELFKAVGNLNTIRSNMRDQTPWAATRQFEKADEELASIQARLRLVNSQMSRGGPSSSLAIGPQQPFQMRPLSDELGTFNNTGRPAAGTANDLADGLERAGKAAKGAHSPFVLLNRYVGVFGSLMAAQELMNMADSTTVVRNRVNIVSDSIDDANSGVEALYEIARRTRAPIEEMAGLYQKGMMAAQELGVAQQDVLKFVEGVGMGLAIQGASANTARGALTQLSQAIGTDIVRAEEFNSILEGAYPIALAAAQGIDEASGSVAKLRRMVIEGEVSSKDFFEAIMSQYPLIAGMFEKTNPTISQAFVILQNSLKDYIDTSEEAQIISAALADAIILIADNIGPLADIIFAIGTALATAFVLKHATNVGKLAASTGLLKASLSGIAGIMGLGGGPIVGGIALMAGAAFLAYQNVETTADKIERLRDVMDNGLTTLDAYNVAVQTAKDKQAELGGVIDLTTESMLRQSRAELQASLEALRSEINDMEAEIGGEGLNPFNLDNIRTAKSELQAFAGLNNDAINNLFTSLEAIEQGSGSIEEFVSQINRARGAGPEIAKAAEDLAFAQDALENDFGEQSLLWVDQAAEQITGIAQAIGGFDDELRALEEFDPANFTQGRALDDLTMKLEQLAQAGNLVRNSSWISDTADLLEALNDARELERSMTEALGANAERLSELAEKAEKFRQPVEGASDASNAIQSTLDNISFSPLEQGARGFADQMVRAANAAASIGSTSMSAPANDNTVMASYNGPVTRANTGGLGLMELNNGGSFTVGGSGGVDQNLVAFWASRGENVLVSQPGQAASSTLGGANRLGQSNEYLSVIKEINDELDTRYKRLTANNEALGIEREVLDATNIAQQAGVVLDQQDVTLIRERVAAISELEQQMSLVQNVGNALFNNLSSALDTFVSTGKFSFKSFASSVIADMSQIGKQTYVTPFLNNIAGGLVGNLLPNFKLPGFNEGADFMVGGTGGVDKNVVSFRASRGERVQVTPASKVAGGGQGNTVVFNITTPDADSFRRSETQMAARAQRMLSRGQRNS